MTISSKSSSLILIGALALWGCGQPVEDEAKGQAPAPPSLVDGKADATNGVVPRGTLTPGEEGALSETFTGKGEFHAYEIALVADAPVTLEVTQKGSSRKLDTMLYIMGQGDKPGAYTELLASDDDSGWGALSRVRDFVPDATGTYLVLVGTFAFAERGAYRLKAECGEGNACAPSAQACVFGDHYSEIFGGAAALAITGRREITASSSVTSLEREQVFAAVTSTYDEPTTYAQAVDIVDQGLINQTRIWDASNRRAYIAYEFGAGDNSYGAIVHADSNQLAALIQDGALVGCTALWGEERKACASSSDCAAGLRCGGVREGQGACFDASATEPANTGSECEDTAGCGDPGLVCAGETALFGGFCSPAWMRRTFAQQPNMPTEDDGALMVTFETFGLATVHTDVSLDLWISHEAPEQVRVTLTNTSGTEVVVFDGAQSGASEIFLSGEVLRFPGDEDANGTWTMLVEDNQAGGTGRVEELALTVTSRWD